MSCINITYRPSKCHRTVIVVEMSIRRMVLVATARMTIVETSISSLVCMMRFCNDNS